MVDNRLEMSRVAQLLALIMLMMAFIVSCQGAASIVVTGLMVSHVVLASTWCD